MALPITEPAGVLAVVLAIVLVAPYLAEKARLPPIVGLALAGVLVGPHGLGLVTAGGTISFLGEVGTLYVFFVAGAELDTARIRRGGAERRNALAFFPLAFGLPFAAGAVGGRLLLGLGLPSSLLLGSALAAVSLLSEPPAQRLGQAGRRALSAASGAAVLANAASMLVLGLALRLAFPPEPGALPLAAAKAALWAAASFLILPRAASIFFKRVKPDGTIEFAFVLALSFLCAYGARLAGIESAVGAFFAGLLLSRFLPESSVIMNRVRFAGDALLQPLFMVYLGALADPFQALGDPASLRELGLVAALGLGSASLAAALAGPALGLPRRERRLLAGLSSGRGATALAIALVALELGLLGRPALDGILLLVVLAGALGSLLSGRAAARPAGPGEQPEAGLARAERILVAVANPSSIRGLVDLAFLLRGRGNREPIYPVAVVPESSDTEAELAAAENRLAQAVVQGVAAEVPVIPSARVSVNAPEGVLKAARENRASAIVIGWNKAPRLSHAFFGSVIEQVILGGEELVVVARATRPLAEVSQVSLVLPVLIERHPGFGRALDALASFVERTGSKLTIYALGGHGAEAKAAARGVASRGLSQLVELGSWKELAAAARSGSQAGRAFVLFSARPGESAWHPAVEKLPHRLGEDFPDATLLLFYLPEGVGSRPGREAGEAAEAGPALPEAAGAAGGPSAEGPEGAARPAGEAVPSARPAGQAARAGDLLDRAAAAGRVRPAMRETAINDGIRELLRSSFPDDRRALGRLAALFTQIAQNEPIELEPGVLLLHAHVEEASEPLVFFGARPEGFRLLALEESVRIVVILCAPLEQSPEEHLAALGEIARLFKDGAVARRLGIEPS